MIDLDQVLRELGHDDPPEAAVTALHARVMAACEPERGLSLSPDIPKPSTTADRDCPRPRVPWWTWAWAPVAAAVLAVVLWPQPAPVEPPRPALPAPAASQIAFVRPQPRPKPAARPRPARPEPPEIQPTATPGMVRIATSNPNIVILWSLNEGDGE